MKWFAIFGRLVASLPYLILTLLVVLVVLSAKGALPDGPYNPKSTYRLGDPLIGFNGAKLRYAIGSARQCRTLLAATPGVSLLDDYHPLLGGDCGIENRVRLTKVLGVDFAGLETRCDSALQLLAWVEYDVKARAISLGRDLARVDNRGSYACRAMRTERGAGARPSLHSYAKAIDISGFRFADGTRLHLSDDWQGSAQSTWRAHFLRSVRDDACHWFNGVLSPDYNALHRDHFHFDLSTRRFCR